MTTYQITLFEKLLAAYGFDKEDYNAHAVANFADDRLEYLDEGSDEYANMDFLLSYAEQYERIVAEREVERAYESAMLMQMRRRRIDPFYTII